VLVIISSHNHQFTLCNFKLKFKSIFQPSCISHFCIMYNEHDRTTVVNQLKRDIAPGMPRRRRSFEDFLAGDENGVLKRQSRKERKIRKESNSRARTVDGELLQSCSDLSPADDSRCIPQISCGPRTKKTARRSSRIGLIKPSSSRRCPPTLPTITEFCVANVDNHYGLIPNF
jgi:hypothetical protein